MRYTGPAGYEYMSDDYIAEANCHESWPDCDFDPRDYADPEEDEDDEEDEMEEDAVAAFERFLKAQ
mgnify:CR=1 FL=1